MQPVLTPVVNSQPEFVFRDPLDESLLRSLRQFSETLTAYGFRVAPYDKASLSMLPQVPAMKKQQVRDYFETWNEWIRPAANEPTPIRIDAEKEKMFAKRALDHYGLFVHDDFWKTVEDDQIIEIYGTDEIQLYRNLNFFRVCGYSLLEISICEWYNLWERPSIIFKEMVTVAKRVMTEKTDITRYSVPRHVLRERRKADATDGYVPQACLVEFKYAASVMRGVDPSPKGAIATSKAEPLASGHEAISIEFV